MADAEVTDLTAVGTPALTDVFYVDQGGTSKKMTGAQIREMILAAGSATAGSWPKLASGTVQTTPDAGSIERDANAFYFTGDAGNRGVVEVLHIIRADATRTFTSNTSSQALFTSPTNGRITLETGLYRIHGMLGFSAMSATSGNLLLNLLGAGTATVAAWMWSAWGTDIAAGTVSAVGGSWMTSSTSPASIVTAAVGTALGVQLSGTFEVTGAGTMIPSMTMVTAASTVLGIGSYLAIERWGSTSMVSVGQWD